MAKLGKPALGGRCQRPNTVSIPENSNSTFARESLPVRSVSRFLSNVTSCDTFATESFGNPVWRAASNTLPGASDQRRLLVSGTHIAVAIRLRFKGSPWITTTGRLRPGPEPVGPGKSAHQISPCEITNRFA